MDYTHIVIYTTADDKEYIFRASDGMRIGGRQNCTVVYGDNPNKSEGKVFMDPEHASRWLRGNWALEDLRKTVPDGVVSLDVRCGDPAGIIVPDGLGDEFMGGAPNMGRRRMPS